MRRLRRSTFVWFVALLLVAFVGFYYALVGFPRTPITKAGADRLFGRALRHGQSLEEVRGWLASQRIRYELLERGEKELYKGSWMPSCGRVTVAECVGLELDAVHSVVVVSYPDAARGLFVQTSIFVYLLFDSKGRLLRHWVEELHQGL